MRVWESEASVGAKKSGNADGAKGCRYQAKWVKET